MDVAVNYLAVVVAGVVAMIIGSLWYSPLLFGKQWMQGRGLDPQSREMHPPVREMVAEFIVSLLNAFVVAVLVLWLGAHTLAGGIMLAFWLWLGFYVPTLLGPVLWEKRSFVLFLLGAGQRLVTILFVASIVTLWQ